MSAPIEPRHRKAAQAAIAEGMFDPDSKYGDANYYTSDVLDVLEQTIADCERETVEAGYLGRSEADDLALAMSKAQVERLTKDVANLKFSWQAAARRLRDEKDAHEETRRNLAAALTDAAKARAIIGETP